MNLHSISQNNTITIKQNINNFDKLITPKDTFLAINKNTMLFFANVIEENKFLKSYVDSLENNIIITNSNINTLKLAFTDCYNTVHSIYDDYKNCYQYNVTLTKQNEELLKKTQKYKTQRNKAYIITGSMFIILIVNLIIM